MYSFSLWRGGIQRRGRYSLVRVLLSSNALLVVANGYQELQQAALSHPAGGSTGPPRVTQHLDPVWEA